jgi:uncharacterized protein (DUF927 family)
MRREVEGRLLEGAATGDYFITTHLRHGHIGDETTSEDTGDNEDGKAARSTKRKNIKTQSKLQTYYYELKEAAPPSRCARRRRTGGDRRIYVLHFKVRILHMDP